MAANTKWLSQEAWMPHGHGFVTIPMRINVLVFSRVPRHDASVHEAYSRKHCVGSGGGPIGSCANLVMCAVPINSN